VAISPGSGLICVHLRSSAANLPYFRNLLV